MSDGFYKIGTLAKLTGVGVAAIRNWERRFQLLAPERTEGGHRLYTEADRKMLERIRSMLDAGRSIGEIATLAQSAVADGSAVPPRQTPPETADLDGLLARCVLEAVPQGIVITDGRGKTTWINPAVTEICGYTLPQLFGRTPGSVLQGAGTDQRAVRHMAAAVAERRACTERLLNYDAKHRPYIAAVDIAPIYGRGRFRGFVGLIRDLTKEGERPPEKKRRAHTARRV